MVKVAHIPLVTLQVHQQTGSNNTFVPFSIQAKLILVAMFIAMGRP